MSEALLFDGHSAPRLVLRSRDYELTVLEDLCLDVDEEVHRVLTTKVFVRQADVMAAADWRP